MWMEALVSTILPAVAAAGTWGVRKIHQHETAIQVMSTNLSNFVDAHETYVTTQNRQHNENREDLGRINQTLSALNEHIISLSGRGRR